MGAFIHRGEYGFWTSNAGRDSFLDWFAERRCGPDDPRRVRCLDGSLRWMGCCPDLAELLPVPTALEATPHEMEEARARDPHLAQVLKMVDLVTTGAWKHGADSDEATWWAVPWVHPGHFTEPGLWSQECLDLHIDFERPEAGRLVEATTAMWSHPHFQGCWMDHDREPEAATRLDPPFFPRSETALWGPPEFEGPPPLYGLARVHGRYVLPCAAYCSPTTPSGPTRPSGGPRRWSGGLRTCQAARSQPDPQPRGFFGSELSCSRGDRAPPTVLLGALAEARMACTSAGVGAPMLKGSGSD